MKLQQVWQIGREIGLPVELFTLTAIYGVGVEETHLQYVQSAGLPPQM